MRRNRGRKREGQPPGRGRVERWRNKQPEAARRHEGCLLECGSPSGAPSLPSCACVDGRRGGAGSDAPNCDRAVKARRGCARSARTTMGVHAFGLFDPAQEKGSCGVGFIADIKGRQSHKLVEDALTILLNLEHRGAVGADPRAGDGAGILTQIPHAFFARKAKALNIALPKPGEYGVGALFMPRDADRRELVRKTFEETAGREGLSILGWRANMPVDNSTLGETVKPTEPFHMQVFIGK